MRSQYLLPHRCKLPAMLLFAFFFVLGLVQLSGHEFDYPFLYRTVINIAPSNLFQNGIKPDFIQRVNIANTVLGVGFILSALMLGFSAEKHEDEYVSGLRLSALSWALIVNYLLLAAAFLLLYDLSFLSAMTYNLFTVLLLFLARFQYLLYKSRSNLPYEE
ncbi:MAG: hypothetical protein QM743_11645 [Chitinophagaceae bacterium]